MDCFKILPFAVMQRVTRLRHGHLSYLFNVQRAGEIVIGSSPM